MEQDQVVELLQILGSGKIRFTGRDWIETNCVLAPMRHQGGRDRMPSFAISVGKSSVACCQACQYSHHVSKLIEDLGVWHNLPRHIQQAIIAEKPQSAKKLETLADLYARVVSLPPKESPAEIAGIRVSGEIVSWVKKVADLPLKSWSNYPQERPYPSYPNVSIAEFASTLTEDVLGYLCGSKRR